MSVRFTSQYLSASGLVTQQVGGSAVTLTRRDLGGTFLFRDRMRLILPVTTALLILLQITLGRLLAAPMVKMEPLFVVIQPILRWSIISSLFIEQLIEV